MTDLGLEDVALCIDDRGVATVSLTRADMHNSLTRNAIVGITKAFEFLKADQSVRVVVLTGDGDSFCAGADLNWFASNLELTRSERIAEGQLLANMLSVINTFPKAIVGRINGSAYGAGVGMISVCDVAIGVARARFALTEVRLGFVPATISPYVVDRIGKGNARRTFLSGAPFDASQALRFGLLHEVVSDDNLDDTVEREVKNHLQAAPIAVADTKKLIDYVSTHNIEENYVYTTDRLVDIWESEEGRTGITKFLNKEMPPWRASDKEAPS